MRVPVKAPCPVMSRVPRSQGIVEQDDLLNLAIAFLDFEKMIVFDPLEIFEGHRLIETFVMVPSDQMLLSLQTLKGQFRLLRPHESEISNDINFVSIRDGIIPIIDKPLVHLLSSLERAIAVFDDVLVAEVKIGSEKNFPAHWNSLIL